MEKVISKTSDELDEKFEHSLKNDIVNIRNDLNSVKVLNKKTLSKIRVCQWYWRSNREDQSPDKDNKTFFLENQQLNNKIRA